MYRASRYNFRLALADRTVLYNARTGQIIELAGGDACTLAETLCVFEAEVPGTAVSPAVFDMLRAGGFVHAADQDELSLVRSAFLRARDETPMVLTITTTMDCNLGCYYCYESRTGDRLKAADVGAIVDHTRERLERTLRQSLHVDWYGGEPLLNPGFMESASAALQSLCRELDVAYHASIISNGTAWPEDVGGFVDRHRLRQVQISFDGLRDHHNRRRRYRAGREADDRGSFDVAWDLVSRLLDHVRVDVRLNLDRHNAGDLHPFVEKARSAGWFDRQFPAVLQPARLSAYSERSAFMRRTELPPAEFDRIRADLRRLVSGTGILIEESEAPDGVPEPKSSVCAALATDSTVVGADGRLYRCGLQVGEVHRAVGRLGDHEVEGPDRRFWTNFDPTKQPQCSHCSFLPVCWSGCPKKHLEGDTQAISEQGLYWRTNLPRLIARSIDVAIEPGTAFTLDEQFRDGYQPAPAPAHPRVLRMVSAGCGC